MGDLQARDNLLPLVYRQLAALAPCYLGANGPDHTLQPTALVNEAYIRLVGQDRVPGRTGHTSSASRRR